MPAFVRLTLVLALLRSAGMRLSAARQGAPLRESQRLASAGSFYARPGHAEVVPPPAPVDSAVDYSLPIRLEMIWPANESIVYGEAGFQVRVFNAEHVTFEVLQLPQAGRVRPKPRGTPARIVKRLARACRIHGCSSRCSTGSATGPATATSTSPCTSGR